MKKVYMALSADILHIGHLNVLEKATKYGNVIVGVLTDKAVASYRRPPLVNYENRALLVKNLKGVTEVVAQHTLDYTTNLVSIKPDYVIHGDDWREGIQREVRDRVIEILKEWGGELIEVPYTQGVSASHLGRLVGERGITPQHRLNSLRRLLYSKSLLRFIDTHNALTGLIAEKTTVSLDGLDRSFDGMWASSLTDATVKGKPDIEAVDVSARAATIEEIFEVTTKPLIFDADTGGKPEHLRFTIRTLERLGVSAAIIEDKIGLKKNSLFGTDVNQTQDSIEAFCHKIRVGKDSQVTDEFMIIARIESLVLGAGMDDAIARAKAYIQAGADGIMVSSRHKTPNEIFEFCVAYPAFGQGKPLVVVPTTYNTVMEAELEKAGVNIVIYANQLLRSAFPAMQTAAESILRFGRSAEIDNQMMSVNDILDLIPGTR